MEERFDDIIRDYIDFVNLQVAVYMDSLAGFQKIRVRVERQIHRVQKPIGKKADGTVVWASFEDPSQPEVIHNRICRAEDYLAANSVGGTNERQQAQAILIFLFSYWENSVRPRLANAKHVDTNEISSVIMGDLRIVRHAILHNKSVLSETQIGKLRKLSDFFCPSVPLSIPYENMHKIFVLIKQDLARMLFEWLGVNDGAVSSDQLRDFAISDGLRRFPR